ncbi:MAG: hypothetical protein LV481_15730 [Methylacidiphilales bacterium]|nr:hypothetical protein [Candidatus Methylacidiphilales bacterium]
MRRVISLLLVFCLFTAPLRANLGETIQQCVARYGKPNSYSEAGPKSPFGTVVFVAGGLILVVFVYNDKEVGARVSKSDKTAFSDADLQTIMGADTAGSAWTSVKSDDPTCLAWRRGDNAQVLYDQVQHMVIFTSTAMSDALHAASAKPAPPNLSSSNAAMTNAAPAN